MKRILVGLGLMTALAGCRSAGAVSTPEPLVFRATPYDAVWEATRATLEAHFPIYTALKQKGEIETTFEITYGQFEFWRDNSAGERDQWENTVQTIRRRARAEVARDTGDVVRVKVQVEKERRDRARQGARFSFAYSASIFDPTVNALDRGLRDPTSPEWTPLGRDPAFEALLLDEVRTRLGGGK